MRIQTSAIVSSITASAAFVVELSLVPLVLPQVKAQLDLSINQLSAFFNSYGVAVAFGVLLCGWLGDAYRTDRVFKAGVCLFAAGAFVVAQGSNYEAIVAGRIIQGLGAGVFTPLVPILLTRSMPHRPGKILIVWSSIVGYLGAFSPSIYGATMMGQSWRFAFVAMSAVALFAVIISLFEPEQGKVQRASSEKAAWNETFSFDLLLMFGYVFFTYGAITFFFFWLPLALSANSSSLLEPGIYLSIVWLTFSLTGTVLRNYVDAPRVANLLLAAPILIACAFFVAMASDAPASLVLSSILIGTGFACSNSPSTQLILRLAPDERRAASVSFDITFARLGGVAFVAVLAPADFSVSVFAIAATSLLGILCVLMAVQRLKEMDA